MGRSYTWTPLRPRRISWGGHARNPYRRPNYDENSRRTSSGHSQEDTYKRDFPIERLSPIR